MTIRNSVDANKWFYYHSPTSQVNAKPNGAGPRACDSTPHRSCFSQLIVFGRVNHDMQHVQYETMLASYMVFYENMYSQYLAGLLDEEIYRGWDNDLASFVETHRIAKRWDAWKDLYRKDFSDHVYKIMQSQKSVPKPTPPQ